MDNLHRPWARVAAVFAVAVVAALAVWALTGTEPDHGQAAHTDGGATSSEANAGESSSRQISPTSSPETGVVLPDGADHTNGLPVQLPYTDLGAVAAHVAVSRAQLGFDYDTARAAVDTYADPADTATFETRAAQAVQQRRRAVGVPIRGRVSPPASYAATPVAYTLHELDTDYYAVTLLSHITLTTVDAEVKDGLYAGTGLVKWIDGDWRLVAGSAADVESVIAHGRPKPAAPGTAEFDEQGWIQLNVQGG